MLIKLSQSTITSWTVLNRQSYATIFQKHKQKSIAYEKSFIINFDIYQLKRSLTI